MNRRGMDDAAGSGPPYCFVAKRNCDGWRFKGGVGVKVAVLKADAGRVNEWFIKNRECHLYLDGERYTTNGRAIFVGLEMSEQQETCDWFHFSWLGRPEYSRKGNRQ